MPDQIGTPSKAIAEEWLALTLDSYPEQTARFLREERDRFRNPVGHSFREGLETLAEELVSGGDGARIEAALDTVLRIRAVQDFTPSEAVGFLFLLKRVVREFLEPAGWKAVDERIDATVLAAFDVFMRCREQLYQARVNESRRRFWTLARVAGDGEV